MASKQKVPESLAPKTRADYHVDRGAKRAYETPDPTPVQAPFQRPPSEPIHLKIRRMIQTELSQAAQEQGFETEEEANDFEVGEDYEPVSLHEERMYMEGPEAPPPPSSPEVSERERLISEGWTPPSAPSEPITPGRGGAEAGGSPQTPPAGAPPGNNVPTRSP